MPFLFFGLFDLKPNDSSVAKLICFFLNKNLYQIDDSDVVKKTNSGLFVFNGIEF